MTLVLTGKDLVLEGSATKIEDKQVLGIYIYMTVESSFFWGQTSFPKTTTDFVKTSISGYPTDRWTDQ